MDYELTRRTLLKFGLSSAALMAMPWSFVRRLDAAVAPHFLVTFIGDGGWDVTQVFDVHDPADPTDGIDVDVPQAVSGLPPSQIATAGGITYISNPTTRPAVDTFFSNWGARSAVVNGIDTRSTSHDQSRQLVVGLHAQVPDVRLTRKFRLVDLRQGPHHRDVPVGQPARQCPHQLEVEPLVDDTDVAGDGTRGASLGAQLHRPGVVIGFDAARKAVGVRAVVDDAAVQ